MHYIHSEFILSGAHLRCGCPPDARFQPWMPPLFPAEGAVQEVTEADAGLGQALGDGRQMCVHVALVHDNHLLRLARIQYLVIGLAPAASVGPHTIPDRLGSGNYKGFVGPRLGTRAGPRGAFGHPHMRTELGSDVPNVSPERALDETAIPHRMEVLGARLLGLDGVAAPVICERH
jgi:hypothetical protein